MRSHPLKYGVLCVLLASTGALAQIEVETQIINPKLEVFFLGDFDINSPSTGPAVFAITLINNFELRRVKLRLQVLKDASEPLSSGETDEFDLQPGQLMLTNQQLFSSLSRYRLVDYSLKGAGEELLEQVLATGQLPSGTYRFEVTVVDLTGENEFPADDIEIVVTNPNTLDLIQPGEPVTAGDECAEVFSTLPQFSWQSDFRRFRVLIAEARAGEDPESALLQSPRFEREFQIGVDIPSTTFQYPASGELLTLEPGKSYYWRVIGIVGTSSGDIEFPSQIYCFRVAETDQLQVGSQELDNLLPSLLNSLGIDPEELFGPGGELEGYHGVAVYYNGAKISIPDLMSRINQMKSEFKGYRIEER